MLRWDESHSVQVKHIDEQHKKWLDAANRFQAAVDSGEAANEFVKLLDFLISYSDYEDAEAHEQQHAVFIEIVQEHIISSDQRYVACFRANGLS